MMMLSMAMTGGLSTAVWVFGLGMSATSCCIGLHEEKWGKRKNKNGLSRFQSNN